MKADSDFLSEARRVVSADVEAVRAALDTIDEDFLAVARLFASCEGKVLVTGSGTSGAVARRAAHLLSVGGTPAYFLPPGDGLHGGLGSLQPKDIVMAISKGGDSKEINEFSRRARTLCGTLVALTAAPESELGRMADHVVCIRTPAEADLGSVVATGSSLAAAAVTDALVELGRLIRGYSWEQILFTHPSGAVGRDAEKSLARLGHRGAEK
jgi:arabinose-5-phosphate isomerase